MTDEAELGRSHAALYIKRPRTFDAVGPRSYAYAEAALDELEVKQRSESELLEILLDGGNQGARQLNVDPVQGLREIVQNADDLGAANVRFGTRHLDGRHELLIVHDGAGVDLAHVLPMIYPFMSTKRGDARSKGRFGVGLKTLARLGGELSIHSPPYHFGARDNLAVRVQAVAGIDGFYDPQASQTLFALTLDDDVEQDFLSAWFSEWTAPDLLFLDTVRTISLYDLDAGVVSATVSVAEVGEPTEFVLDVAGSGLPTIEQEFDVQGRRWLRFVALTLVPQGRRRDGKATLDETPIGIALPVDGEAVGRIHVALPTAIHTGTCFAIDGQFDPATSREGLVNDGWNRWLVDTATAMAGSLAIKLARDGSPLAWSLVPIAAEPQTSAKWLTERLAAGWSRATEQFASEQALIPIAEGLGLDQVSYSDRQVEELLEPADYVALAGKPVVPVSMRDPAGRWRRILDALGVTRCITFRDLLAACGGDYLDLKPAEWFISLAEGCLDQGLSSDLLGTRWVPLSSGDRAAAEPAATTTKLLVAEAPHSKLAADYALIAAVNGLLLHEEHKAVLQWLSTTGNFVQEPNGQHLLGTFARRFGSTPVDVSRTDLCEMRDLFAEVPETALIDLGRLVGHAVRIEAQQVERSSRLRNGALTIRALPTEVYLPASIEEQRDGWSSAADATPGLFWALPSYAEALKIPGRSLDQRGGRRRGAKRFLTLLGARTTPRLEKVQTPVSAKMPALQLEAPQRLGRAPGTLVDDYISPDLELVVADIVASARGRQRGGGRRRAAVSSAERGIALFKSLAQAWADLEDCATTRACRDSRRGASVEVPSTWVARLAEAPWLATRAGRMAPPMGLAIATRVTSAMSDNPAGFAAGLGQVEAEAPLARALAMSVDPPASKIVQSIDDYRGVGTASDAGNVLRLYRALAGHCPPGPAVPSVDARVSDLTVNSLRGRFGISSKRSGLIAGGATTLGDARWYAPSAVFAGRDIFHQRRPFVLNDRELTPLWLALNITTPSLDDCVRELEAVATTPAWPEREAMLIDIYRHLDRMLDRTSAAGRRALQAIPLLCGGAWTTSRPIYTSPLPGLAIDGVSIWSPPCAISTIPRLVAALGVTELPVKDAPLALGLVEDDDLQRRFDVAMRFLKASLAREDEASYRAMTWDDLSGMPVQLHHRGTLHVVVEPPARRGVSVPVRAHADLSSKTIHVDDWEALGRFEFGGQAVAAFAETARHREVGLAWVSAWASSVDVTLEAAIDLAQEEKVSDLDALAKIYDRLKRSDGKRRMPSSRTGGAAPPEPERKVEVRRLKTAPAEFTFTAELRADSPEARKGPQKRRTTPLQSDPPLQKTPPQQNKPAPASAHRQYDTVDLQRLGWEHLLMAVAEGRVTVTDFQSLRGVGADGAIDWRTFVELKATGREAPSQISFTEKEFQRAQERKGEYLLVVVSGLEEGFATQVAIFENPLASLPWSVKGSVAIGGLASGRAVVLTERQEAAASATVASPREA